MDSLTARGLAAMFDHTLLNANACLADFERVAAECREYHFSAMAVNSAVAGLCKKLLEGSGVLVAATVSFPLGQMTLKSKLFETEDAIGNGAGEIDYVINISELKNGNWDYLEKEMSAIAGLCREHNVISKVIFETCYLTKDEIVTLSGIARQVRPDFIKTSTGFGPGGAAAENVALMKQSAGENVKIKASGGIRDLKQCLAMIDAGAQRIGCSASVKILNEFTALNGN